MRSVHHASADHGAGKHWILTGHASSEPNPRSNDRPSVGSVVAKLRGANHSGLPSYVAIPKPPAFAYAGYLGPGYNPFSLDAEPQAGTKVQVQNLSPPDGVSLERISERKELLTRLDRVNRRRDLSGTMDGMDRFTAEAYAMITGPAAQRAFDLSTEDPKLRRVGYGPDADRPGASLLARRLVEGRESHSLRSMRSAGTIISGSSTSAVRAVSAALDAAIATLVEDISRPWSGRPGARRGLGRVQTHALGSTELRGATTGRGPSCCHAGRRCLRRRGRSSERPT